MTLRLFLALEMATFLAWNSASSRPTVLGVVVEANRAHLNTGTVSAGATVYDGDNFSTETRGQLLLNGDAALLDLAEESVMIVRSKIGEAKGCEVELNKGTLVLSAARASAVEILAWEARIRPVADVRTIAQVSVAGPKELRIYAKRGSLQFSYRGDAETIAEGASYRVILDPPGDDPKNRPVKTGRHRKQFLLIAIAAAAAGTAVILYEHVSQGHKPMESPDRP